MATRTQWPSTETDCVHFRSLLCHLVHCNRTFSDYRLTITLSRTISIVYALAFLQTDLEPVASPASDPNLSWQLPFRSALPCTAQHRPVQASASLQRPLQHEPRRFALPRGPRDL